MESVYQSYEYAVDFVKDTIKYSTGIKEIMENRDYIVNLIPTSQIAKLSTNEIKSFCWARDPADPVSISCYQGPGVFCWLFSWLADFTNKTWPQKLENFKTMD